MSTNDVKLLLQLKTTGVEQLKEADRALKALKADAEKASKASGLSMRDATRAARVLRNEQKEAARAARAAMSGPSVAGEMAKIQRQQARREMRGQAMQQLGLAGGGNGFLAGHGFVNKTRQIVGGVRDLTVAAYGAQMAFGAIGGAVGSVLDPLRAFQSRMGQIQAKGFDAAKMGELGSFLKTIGTTTQFSQTQAAEAGVALAAAGITDVHEMKAALPTALKFAQASGMDTTHASDTLVDVAGQFGMAPSEFERIGDAMQKAADMSTIGVEQLAESLKYAGAIAKQAGFSLEDTTATIALLGERGIKGSEAGTALRGIFTRMARPTKMANEALAGLGLKKEDLHKFINDRNIPGYFAALNQRMKDKKYTDAQRLEASKAIFGQEQVTAAMNLMVAADTQGKSGKNIWAEYIAKNRDAAGALQRTADIMGDTVEGKIQKFNASLETAKITLAEQFLPELNRFIPRAAEAAASVGRWTAENGGLVRSVAGLATGGLGLAAAWKGLTLVGGVLGALPGAAAITAAGATFGTTFAAGIAAGLTGYFAGKTALEWLGWVDENGAYKELDANGNPVGRVKGERGMDGQPYDPLRKTQGARGLPTEQENVTGPRETSQFNAVTGQIEITVKDERVKVRTVSKGAVGLRTGSNPSAPVAPTEVPFL